MRIVFCPGIKFLGKELANQLSSGSPVPLTYVQQSRRFPRVHL